MTVLVGGSACGGPADLVSIREDVQFANAVRDSHRVQPVRTKGCPYRIYSRELHSSECLLGALGKSEHVIGASEPHSTGTESTDCPAWNID
jgi:hypothetical protein